MKNVATLIRENWIIILVLLIPFPFIAAYWNQIPDQVPIHWNLEGKVDGYGSKAMGMLFTPILNIALFFCLLLVRLIDPKKENYDLFKPRYHGIRLSLHLLFLALFVFTLLTSLHYAFDFNKAMQTVLLLFMLALGNYLTSIRPNYFVGIRTPWTLANEDVWVKTHRMTGRLWVITSLLLLIAVWALNISAYFTLAGIVLMALIPIAYSYIIFQKAKHHHS